MKLATHSLLGVFYLAAPLIVESSEWGRYRPSWARKTDSKILSCCSVVPRCGDVDSPVSTKDTDIINFYIFKGGLCPFAGRTWIVLLELGLPFDMVYIDYNVENPWFLEVNPRGRVPALHNPTDGTTVYESAICNEYLVDLARDHDDKNDGPLSKLMPNSPSGRARLRLLIDMFDKDVFTPVREYIMNEDATKNEEMQVACTHALTMLQDAISGKYFLGDDFTLADAHVVPFFMRWKAQLHHVKDYNILSKFPSLAQWYERCQLRESVQTATISDEKIIELHKLKVKLLNEKAASGVST
jgi:glutathione S-transferase